MFRLVSVRADVDACDCTGELTDTVRIYPGSGLWEKENPLPHLGLEPASVLRLAFQSDTLPTELFI